MYYIQYVKELDGEKKTVTTTPTETPAIAKAEAFDLIAMGVRSLKYMRCVELISFDLDK